MSAPWRVERTRDVASHALAGELPQERTVRIVSCVAPAVVLGSTQRDDVVDATRARAAGFEIVRRRGGGGAVLVGPGEHIWAEVFVPAGDERWSPDVALAFHWLGAAWTAALADLGVEATWHDGALCTTTWSRLVCFAGLGSGEVSIGGRKVVGLSQRRSRAGSLFMCAALLKWEPWVLVDVLALTDGDRARAAEELAPVATGLAVGEAALTNAFLDQLRRR